MSKFPLPIYSQNSLPTSAVPQTTHTIPEFYNTQSTKIDGILALDDSHIALSPGVKTVDKVLIFVSLTTLVLLVYAFVVYRKHLRSNPDSRRKMKRPRREEYTQLPSESDEDDSEYHDSDSEALDTQEEFTLLSELN